MSFPCHSSNTRFENMEESENDDSSRVTINSGTRVLGVLLSHPTMGQTSTQFSDRHHEYTSIARARGTA